MRELLCSLLRGVSIEQHARQLENDTRACERAPVGSRFQDGAMGAWYWYEALSGPLGMAINRADSGFSGSRIVIRLPGMPKRLVS